MFRLSILLTMTQSSRYLHLPSQSWALPWRAAFLENRFLFKRGANLIDLLAELTLPEIAEDGCSLTIFVTRLPATFSLTSQAAGNVRGWNDPLGSAENLT